MFNLLTSWFAPNTELAAYAAAHAAEHSQMMAILANIQAQLTALGEKIDSEKASRETWQASETAIREAWQASETAIREAWHRRVDARLDAHSETLSKVKPFLEQWDREQEATRLLNDASRYVQMMRMQHKLSSRSPMSSQFRGQ
jgi:beta-phosphoglucomutase-like phosphatase (HAD superfamily)